MESGGGVEYALRKCEPAGEELRGLLGCFGLGLRTIDLLGISRNVIAYLVYVTTQAQCDPLHEDHHVNLCVIILAVILPGCWNADLAHAIHGGCKFDVITVAMLG